MNPGCAAVEAIEVVERDKIRMRAVVVVVPDAGAEQQFGVGRGVEEASVLDGIEADSVPSAPYRI